MWGNKQNIKSASNERDETEVAQGNGS